MPKTLLTPKYITHTIQAAPKGTRIDHWDTNVEGLSVRVTDKGAKSFSLLMRLNGKPTRSTIGPVGKWTLDAARDEARTRQRLIIKGDNPTEVRKAAARAKLDDADKMVDAVLTRYIADKLPALVKCDEVAAILQWACEPWTGRHIDTIKTKDVADRVLAKKAEGSPEAGRGMLAKVSKFFKWARATGVTENLPCYGISATELFGQRPRRKVVLTDDQLEQVWRGALSLGYPLGPIVLLLILTGLRLNSVVGARRAEIDRKSKLWTIPAERMKGKGENRAQFTVPLTPQILAVFDSLPRFNQGDCLFSIDNGVSPMIWGSGRDNEVRKAAKFWKWCNHDLRRTMRTRLEAPPIGMSYTHAEAMIAHKQPLLGDIYNQYKYPTEMRAGMHAWNAEVVRITGGLPRQFKLAA